MSLSPVTPLTSEALRGGFPCSSGRFLISGDTEGVVSVWDTQTAPPEANEELLQPQLRFQAHWDCTNGVR